MIHVCNGTCTHSTQHVCRLQYLVWYKMFVLLNATYVCIYIPLTLPLPCMHCTEYYLRTYIYVCTEHTPLYLKDQYICMYACTKHTPFYLNNQCIRTYMRTYSTQHVRTCTFRLYVLCAVNTQTSAYVRTCVHIVPSTYVRAHSGCTSCVP